jgi:hypothetical protein
MRLVAVLLAIAVVAANAPSMLSAQPGPAPPGGGGPIFVHPLSHFIDVFEEACLKARREPSEHLKAARDSRWRFAPIPDFSETVAAKSVSVSVRPRGGRKLCSVSGLANGSSSLDDAITALRDRFSLGEPLFGIEARITEVAIWGHGTASTITVSASPQRVTQADRSSRLGPAHVVLSLSYP